MLLNILSPTVDRLNNLVMGLGHLLEVVVPGISEAEDVEGSSCMPNLNASFVVGLKHVYPKGLQFLEHLGIRHCPQLLQVFNMEKVERQVALLSNLKILELCSLPKLESLWELKPSHQIHIDNCNKLKTIFLPCLAQSMLYIEKLFIFQCDGLEKVIDFAQENEIWENDCPLYCWPKLKILRREFCPNLEYVCANTSTQWLQSLESLYISYCPQLVQVFNMEQNEYRQDIVLPGFGSQNYCCPKLKTLRIMDCQLLQYVFTNTLSQGFPLLESVYIENCPQLLQVFSPTEERDVIDDHILLNVPFLQNLSVSNCPQFSCFIVQAHLMEELVLSNVGNIRQLCNTDFPVLNEDCIVVGNHEVFQVQSSYSFSSIKKLYFTNLFGVRIIWNDFAQVVTLENLTTLKLSDCKRLRYIFSPTMARSLSQLVDLCIERCDEIERLILAKDQVSSSSSNGDIGLQPISFPNLTKVIVTNCENLKSLFPFGFVSILPKLARLIVKRNSKLEQVFKLEDEVEVAAEQEIKFDELNWLSLEELPSLIHFCPKGYEFVLSALRDLKVRHCPKLTTDFFIDSKQFVHCKTKSTTTHYMKDMGDFRAAFKAMLHKVPVGGGQCCLDVFSLSV
ncbi:hypothetical protein V6Z12_D05G417900 [Gossypium hirsutum]